MYGLVFIIILGSPLDFNEGFDIEKFCQNL